MYKGVSRRKGGGEGGGVGELVNTASRHS